MPELTAILLVGHGARDERGAAEFFELAGLVAERFAPTPVVPCFLELAEPTIDAAVRRAVESGAQRVVVVPVLLFAAGHAKRDIPAVVDAAVRRAEVECGRRVSWRQTDVLECHPKLLELSARRYAEAVADEPIVGGELSDGDTCLVVVGRGSQDHEATAAMRRFAAKCAEMSGVRRCETAFIAMAEPKYPAVLRAAAERRHARIVVQPHLLFEGELLARLQNDVNALGDEFPASKWRIARHLGPDALLVDAVESLCRAAVEA